MPVQDSPRCRGCGAKIEFALNPSTGRRVPLNPVSDTSQKDPQARWAVWDNPAGGYFVRTITTLEPFNMFDEHLAINHFAVCTRTGVSRGKRRRDPARART